MVNRVFSSLELGIRLRELRLRAQLTQVETADRMGLGGKQRRKTIERLEHGRISNPSLDTIGRLLRACGASWGEISGVLDRGQPVEIDSKPIADSEFEAHDKQRLEWAVEKQVRKFETKLATPIGGKPLHPEKQAEAVRKLRNYRMVVSIIEEAVAKLLADKPVVSIEYPRYKAVAREVVGLLWREVRRSQKSKGKSQNGPRNGECKMQSAECRMQNGGADLADKLAEKAECWGTQKLDAELVREVQEAVIQRFAALQETNPELF